MKNGTNSPQQQTHLIHSFGRVSISGTRENHSRPHIKQLIFSNIYFKNHGLNMTRAKLTGMMCTNTSDPTVWKDNDLTVQIESE
jgi:hypothetical protein